ncbi:MAG: hypothetical protein LAO03_18280 [Acidobacteriia bacterium]|nr:hypothetical protein [Terriglobia bacterium]
MPFLAAEAPAEPKKKRNKLETGLIAFMGLVVLGLLASVASTTFNWLAPSFLHH